MASTVVVLLAGETWDTGEAVEERGGVQGAITLLEFVKMETSPDAW